MTVINMPNKSKGTLHSKQGLSSALKYITDPQKTNNGELVSGQNIIIPSNAYDEMLLTREMAILAGNQPKENERFGFHFVQSFSPEDNLTPEQVHEIGLKTMKAYLGESAEFVIATHTDKEHLHNHIILNATNPKTLKKFQQSKSQLEELKEISDVISKEYGCKIIDRSLKNSHKKYQVYLAKNSYRKEIKSKIKFLLSRASNWNDFKNKANALGLIVDDKGKYTTYQLSGTSQERKVRDRSLKNQAFMKEFISERLKENEVVYTESEVKELWAENQTIQDKEQETEIEMLIEDWQVEKETADYLYVNINIGLEREQRKSAIKIPARCVDKLENGNYQVFLKKQDRFYFVDSKNPENNKIMLGKTVAKNLQNQSGSVPLYSNNAKIKLKQLFNEFDFLISKGLDFDTSFETIGKELEQTYYQTESILENLDKKILEYVEENKAYARPNTRILKTIENLQKERTDLHKTLKQVEKEMLYYDKSVDRYEDYQQEHTKNKSQHSPRL
ncbi:relaxase/mobilization nuclease domain-containing protein (plasmid) [Lactococcus lactis]|uniref:Phage prohead protease, HK97 family n=1 Tax=Carnobacterium maltaromaticum TaxID=2751 RepID=A0A1Z5AXE2_CARML|nr:primosome assembly protein PriA [Listeria monocytogenes]EAG3629321.1 primosome assembly protein PriA [Listeria monocytogenes]EBD1483662.1 primosome assembly protein PriA [Listeria monocytogenes]CRI06741.1 Phage prohead protease, HK97 family [Carnobacterium maltaromaticum]